MQCKWRMSKIPDIDIEECHNNQGSISCAPVSTHNISCMIINDFVMRTTNCSHWYSRWRRGNLGSSHEKLDLRGVIYIGILFWALCSTCQRYLFNCFSFCQQREFGPYMKQPHKWDLICSTCSLFQSQKWLEVLTFSWHLCHLIFTTQTATEPARINSKAQLPS
jgi:hypothetical protein